MKQRIILKVGTKVITQENGSLDLTVLRNLANQIDQLKKQNYQVVLVTSGAVGAGREVAGKTVKDRIEEKSVLAAIGQVKLMTLYSSIFQKLGYTCAQVLVTKEDFRDRAHYLNMRNCFEKLLIDNIIPIVNENDVVATTELLFTDNDELTGLVAAQLNADHVIILTSVDGLLVPNKESKNLEVVHEIALGRLTSFEKFITPEKSAFGRGGMLTKFGIAKKLAQQGIVTFMANGKKKDTVLKILSGEMIGTKFVAGKKLSALKRRIAYSEGVTHGTIVVNVCARDLLISNTKIMSLLPVGITKVEGDFEKGDIVNIQDEDGKKLGFGVSRYKARDVRHMAGKKNQQPVIHYNYMFINA